MASLRRTSGGEGRSEGSPKPVEMQTLSSTAFGSYRSSSLDPEGDGGVEKSMWSKVRKSLVK